MTLGLTLLRCVGWLSRDDLSTRYKHAGPGLETPGAQCLGLHISSMRWCPMQATGSRAQSPRTRRSILLRSTAPRSRRPRRPGHACPLPPASTSYAPASSSAPANAVKTANAGSSAPYNPRPPQAAWLDLPGPATVRLGKPGRARTIRPPTRYAHGGRSYRYPFPRPPPQIITLSIRPPTE